MFIDVEENLTPAKLFFCFMSVRLDSNNTNTMYERKIVNECTIELSRIYR